MARKRPESKGGLKGLDPEIEAWKAGAAENVAALSSKQKYDRARIRVRLDLPGWLKDALTSDAESERTSANQFGTFLLAWALWKYRQGDTGLREAVVDGKRMSRALRVDWDLEIPEEIQDFFTNGAE